MNWKPIEEYDASKLKPKYCVFYVEPVPAKPGKTFSLGELIVTDRYFGSRTVSKYFALPDPK